MVDKEKREGYNKSLQYNGQAFADKFVLNCTDFKRDGYFLELGSREAKRHSNSYILEKSFGWKGVMVDKVATHKADYEADRPNSISIIQDATQIDYKKVFEDNNFPSNLDFWQLDLEVRDNTALETLIKIDKDILDCYKFATVTIEHDIYTGFPNAANTRIKSREILESRGYYCVFKDTMTFMDGPPNSPYEDWWVHPDLVNMEYIKSLREKNQDKYLMINVIGYTAINKLCSELCFLIDTRQLHDSLLRQQLADLVALVKGNNIECLNSDTIEY